MRIIAIIAAAAALLVTSSAEAATLKKGSPVCITADLLHQLRVAVAATDMRALEWLSDNGCTVSDRELPVSLLPGHTDGSVRVRAYRGDISAEVWVDSAFIDF